MKVIVSSDFHGHLPEIIKPFDLFLICGDICPAHSHYFAFQINWLNTVFAEWINSLPFKDENSKVVMTWGNHDFVGEKITADNIKEFNDKTNNRVVILNNETYKYEYFTKDGPKSLRIFGTPYCKIFYNWAFMRNDDFLKEAYSCMPLECDIVISHDSPTLNNLGLIQEGFQEGFQAGNVLLDEEIITKKPKYFFSGHIHSGNHNFENVRGTMMANVSYINENYKPTYDILEFDI